MAYTLIKFDKIGPTKERLKVKSFKTSEARASFLAKQTDNRWQIPGDMSYLRVPYPTKSGTYAAAGGQWHNVKDLPASVKAHV